MRFTYGLLPQRHFTGFLNPLCNCSSCAAFINKLGAELKSFSSFKSFGTSDLTKVDPHVKKILENNQKWVKETNQRDPKYYKNMSMIQKPKVLYVGCSDSRIPANEMLGLHQGDVFVHRNIGNVFHATDLNALSVLEYAVGHLDVADIVIVGHYDCGAVRAATSRQDLGTLENWTRQIRDVYRLHKDHLDEIKNEEERHLQLVEFNVIEQCLNVYKTGIVQRKRMQSAKLVNMPRSEVTEANSTSGITPRIHGLVFHPSTGLLKQLTVDFRQRIGPLDHIYGLY